MVGLIGVGRYDISMIELAYRTLPMIRLSRMGVWADMPYQRLVKHMRWTDDPKSTVRDRRSARRCA